MSRLCQKPCARAVTWQGPRSVGSSGWLAIPDDMPLREAVALWNDTCFCARAARRRQSFGSGATAWHWPTEPLRQARRARPLPVPTETRG